jgi:hypothetical protein
MFKSSVSLMEWISEYAHLQNKTYISTACFVTRPQDTEDLTESYHERDAAGCSVSQLITIKSQQTAVFSHVTASCNHSNSMYELQFVSTWCGTEATSLPLRCWVVEETETECNDNYKKTCLWLVFTMTHCKQKYGDIMRKSDGSLSASFFTIRLHENF